MNLSKNESLSDFEKSIVDCLKDEYHTWCKSLTREELRLIRKYTKNSYGDLKPNRFFERLNRTLRGDYHGKDKDKLLKYGKIISNAVKTHPVQRTIICYRGVDENLFSPKEIGITFKFNQFISTSVVKKGALKKKYKYVIVVPRGTTGAYIDEVSAFDGQYEFLLDYDCRYKLKAMNEKTVYLEVLL